MAELKESHEPLRVSVSLGYTKNMGNFESLRLDFAVEDSARNGEKANEAFARVYDFVEQKLIDKISELEEAAKQ